MKRWKIVLLIVGLVIVLGSSSWLASMFGHV
jgi:hypothetical protein